MARKVTGPEKKFYGPFKWVLLKMLPEKLCNTHNLKEITTSYGSMSISLFPNLMCYTLVQCITLQTRTEAKPNR